MKKTLAIILAFALVAALSVGIALTVSAADGMIVVSEATIKRGDTKDITVSFINSPGITAAKIRIAYPDDVTLNSVTFNASVIGGMSGTNKKPKDTDFPNPVVLSWLNGGEDVSGDVLFATLSFTVAADAAVGEKALEVTYNDADIADTEETEIPFGKTDGKITVVDCYHEHTSHVDAVASTCHTNGHAAYTVCDDCKAVIEGSNEPLPLDTANHEGGTEKRGVAEETCTADGYTGDTYCIGCGARLESGQIIPKLGHDYKDEVIEPTCTEAGYTRHTCSRCGDVYDSDTVKALGHDYAAEVTERTCTEQGYTTHTCSRCGDSYKDAYVESLGGHAASDWIIDKKANLIETGLKHKECTVCGEILEEEELPVIDSNAPRFEIESKTVRAGEQVDVELYVKNSPGITTAKLRISYPEDLTLDSVTFGDLGGLKSTSPTLESPALLNWSDGSVDLTGDFTLATLHFTAAEDAQAGDKIIEISFNPADIDNVEEQEVAFAEIDGTVKVTRHIPGDINDDGSVDNKDHIRLFQYLSDWGVDVNQDAVDVNGDGAEDNKDLIRLFQYLSDWGVEIF